jgi:hypothetical protein
MVVLGQHAAQLAQSPLRVRVGIEEQVGDKPEQPHHQVAPVPRPRGFSDQLLGQSPALGTARGIQQAVVRQAQRLDRYDRMLRRPRLVQDGEYLSGLTPPVGGFADRPDPEP